TPLFWEYFERAHGTERQEPPGADTGESEQTEIVMCQAPHGTIQSWQEAATKLGFRFRYNTLNETGQVLIPLRFETEANGGGQWKQIDDIARSTVVASIEAHAMAYTVGKKPYLKGVFLPKEKSRDAITSLFAANRYCPFREYLDGLPKWCGKPIINKSMERGGMYVDAGPFTESVQAHPWIFAVRNTLFPGSSNREHIVLHGPHNSGKSKFVKEMLPVHLREYYNEAFSMDGSLKVKLERSMGKILMECAEFNIASAQSWNSVKQWLTLSEVSGERLAYKEYARRHRLTATTIFSTNSAELPPCEPAVLSRFIWVNVETPATSLDGLVWTHFDSYYDAEHPEMGTWRDQYFAEALHIVNQYTEKAEHQTGGTKQISYRCNPKWLPKDHIPALIEWNKNAGGTFTTEIGDLVIDTIQAIGLLQDWYGQMSIDNRNFFPTAELIHAIVCVRDGVDYSDWWELARDAKGDPLSGEARRKSEVERAVSPIKLANAMPAVGEEMGVKFIKKQKKWETDNRKQPVRGFEMEWPKDE
ncbi:MAG: hypothetical protein ISN29_04995, partial [Gammaproteobacteria bacterium AqS3]|nr:hypothetical protein [Gammaproteobacteria bacterium AqS3]